MRLNSKWLALLIILAVLPLSVGCGFMNKLEARDNVNKGVKMFTDQKYDAAAQYFTKALEMDPNFMIAKVYLATAYSYQFVPGSTDPKSEEMANKAIETFGQVVDQAAPNSKTRKEAMLSIASMNYQLKRYDQSKEWCNKLLAEDPQNAEAHYRIAVMDYDDVLEKTGIQGENIEFLSAEEKAKAIANVDEGLFNIEKAIQIRPEYFDAMQYQNLLWREKAKFEKDEKVKAELIRKALQVSQKALQLQRKQEEIDAANKSKIAVKKKE